ncbi:MAG: hypothetical protein FJ298_04690 [Planctomycetes bacterium]|nr:hypothetical protein [Planctomycetota bacterium]
MPSPLPLTSFAALALAAGASAQSRQPLFSIDWKSPSVGSPDSLLAQPITEGDLLFAPAPSTYPQFGPAPTPAVHVKAGPAFVPAPMHLGLARHAACVGHAGGTPCGIEVDALCTGKADWIQPNQPIRHLYLSVDSDAVGMMVPLAPNVASEAPLGESAADVLVSLALGPGPLPPFGTPMPGSTAVLDGNGLQGASAFRYRGVGLREPTFPGAALPTSGDNLDALASWLPRAGYPWPRTGLRWACSSRWTAR